MEYINYNEWAETEIFANRIASFALYRDCYTVESLRYVNPSIEEIYEVVEALIDSWEEIGIPDSEEMLQTALDPIFSDIKSPDGFKDAIANYQPLREEYASYMILSAEEFLVRAEDPLEIKRMMVGAFSHDVWYYYLHTINERCKHPEFEGEGDDNNPSDVIKEEIMRQLENQPIVDPEVLEACVFVEAGIFPPDFAERSTTFMIAYKDELEAKACQVIGCNEIDYVMRNEEMSFNNAHKIMVDKARLIVTSKKYLQKLQLLIPNCPVDSVGLN